MQRSFNLSNQINIAMPSNQLAAGNLNSNFSEKIKEFITNYRVFTFVRSIKWTTVHWKKLLLNVLAMVRKLGVPTFFMKFLIAYLK